MANKIQRAVQRVLGIEERKHPGAFDTAPTAQSFVISGQSIANVPITEDTALAISAAYACVSLISRTMAALDLDILTKRGRNTVPANHPARYLFQMRPNSYESAFEFMQTLYANAVWRGVGLAYLETDGTGEVVAMHVLNNNDCILHVYGKERYYTHPKLGVIRQENIIELPSMYRMSPILAHRDNLGLTKAAQDYGSRYFRDGGQISGILSAQQPLDAETAKNLQESIEKQKESGTNTVFMPFGTNYARVAITAEEAQFLGTRKFQNEEVCRMFGVPPALIFVDSGIKYSNFEHQQIMFGQHCVMPWAELAEQVFTHQVLLASDRAVMRFKFDLAGLYKADMKTRADYYDKMVRNGVMSINEAREAVGMNPTEGGDVHLFQTNQIGLDYIDEWGQKLTDNEQPNQRPSDPAA
jgi:HK97 family phage portal protein